MDRAKSLSSKELGHFVPIKAPRTLPDLLAVSSMFLGLLLDFLAHSVAIYADLWSVISD